MAFIPAMTRGQTGKRSRSGAAQPAWNTPEPKSSPNESIQRRVLRSHHRLQTSPVRGDAWTSSPETSEPESSAAEPGYPASIYALDRIMESIDSANADLYLNWKRSTPHPKRKTMSKLVGHVQWSMKHAFQSGAEQPAHQGIPLDVLIGCVLEKCNQHNASIEDAKAMLRRLAVDVHLLFRMECIVGAADELKVKDLTAEKRVDRLVLNQCERLCLQEMSRTRDALKTLARSSNQDAES